MLIKYFGPVKSFVVKLLWNEVPELENLNMNIFNQSKKENLIKWTTTAQSGLGSKIGLL